MKRLLLLLCCSLAVFPQWAAAKSGPDTLVICPAPLQSALQPWLQYRREQGHTIVVRAPANTSYGTRQIIVNQATAGGLRRVLIVGDAQADVGTAATMCVPTDYVPAQVNVRFGSTPEIATDHTYGDMNEDGIADLAMGRLPVDSAAELSRAIDRIIKYETGSDFGMWRRRINLIAGVGGFGEFQDKLIEKTAKRLIADMVPAEYQATMTYGSWSSSYCPDPRLFCRTAIGRFNEGCLFWVYMGHGHPYRLDRIRVPGAHYPIMEQEHLPYLHSQNGSPIAVLLACYAGAFDFPEDCIAEQMFRAENGPVAVLCGSRVTMPYSMCVLSLELMNEYFKGQHQALGDLLLTAKRNMMNKPTGQQPHRQLVDALGQAFSPTGAELQQELQEHQHLMHLLGDPLLRISQPQAIQLQVPARAVSGQTVAIRGDTPLDGRVTIELVYSRDRYRHRPKRRTDFDPQPDALASFQTEYERANDWVCVRQASEHPAGEFQTSMVIPGDANGQCFVRAFHQGEHGFAMGSAPIEISAQRVAAQSQNDAQR